MTPDKLWGQFYWVGVFVLTALVILLVAIKAGEENEGPVRSALTNKHWTNVTIDDSGNATGLEGCKPHDVTHYHIYGTNPSGRTVNALICCDVANNCVQRPQ